jgi:hypothetical protein
MCQFAIDSAALSDVVKLDGDSDFISIKSDARSQMIALTDNTINVIEQNRVISSYTLPTDLANIVAFVVSGYFKDFLQKAINEEYNNK